MSSLDLNRFSLARPNPRPPTCLGQTSPVQEIRDGVASSAEAGVEDHHFPGIQKLNQVAPVFRNRDFRFDFENRNDENSGTSEIFKNIFVEKLFFVGLV